MKQHSFFKKPFGFVMVLVASFLLTLSLYSCGGSSSSTQEALSNLTPITQDNALTIGATQNNAVREIGNISNAISNSFGPISDSIFGTSTLSSTRYINSTNQLQQLFNKIKNITSIYSKSSVLKNTLISIKNNSTRVSMPYTGQDNCSFGGTYSYTGTYDSSSGDYDVTYTFNSCDTGNSILNGNFILKGIYTHTKFDFSITTDNLTTIPDDNKTSPVVLKNIFFTFNGTKDDTTGDVSLKVITNGTFNYYYSDSYNNHLREIFTCNNLSYDTNTSGDGNNVNIAVNGKITDKSVSDNDSITTTFNNFAIGLKIESDGSSDATVNGTISIQYSPGNFCPEGSGTYEFVTNTPMHTDSVSDITTGRLTINNSEVITYNNDGTITVTLNGNTIYSGSEEGFLDDNGECTLGIAGGGDI